MPINLYLQKQTVGQIISHGLPSPDLAKRELESGGHVAGGILDKEWHMQRLWQGVTGGYPRERAYGAL